MKSDFGSWENPSSSPFPVFVLCPPYNVATSIPNNAWMLEAKPEDLVLDKEKFLGQWYEFYKVLSSNALVYLLPAKKGLQDQTYVNSFCYLPHYKDKPSVVLSNFKGKGRSGEEIVAGEFLTKLGYHVYTCPHYFEGEAELKWSGHENIYYGGYGQRSSVKTYDWIEQKFGAKIIRIQEKDSYLYHLDCNLFVLNKNNVMVCTENISKRTLKEIEKIAKIHNVSSTAAYQGICNSLRVGEMICNASSLSFMSNKDKYYREESKKNEELENICDKVGLELMYFDMSELMKSGALLSCLCAKLNYLDMEY